MACYYHYGGGDIHCDGVGYDNNVDYSDDDGGSDGMCHCNCYYDGVSKDVVEKDCKTGDVARGGVHKFKVIVWSSTRTANLSATVAWK